MDPLDLLPHRPPMRLLDEVVELVPGTSARARRTVRAGDFFLDGHFPGEPVVPAVILVELLVEAGASLSARDAQFQSTPLEWAGHLGHEEIARILRRASRR